jgi:hypothetical protein
VKCVLSLAILSTLSISTLAAPSCKSHKGMTAIDLSQPVTTITTKSGKSGPSVLKSIGVKTVARYYAWANGETTCKTLFPEESDAIIAAGLNIVTVFQHENSDPETFFKPTRGTTDAKEALQLADHNGQPPGSAIYFAVDGVDQTIKDVAFEFSLHRGKPVPKGRRGRLLRADQSFKKHIEFYNRYRNYHRRIFKKAGDKALPSDILPFVQTYFEKLNVVMKADGRFKVGVYGSGAVCRHIMSRGLADYCWLAMSEGWPGTREYLRKGKWVMAQQQTTFCRDWKFEGREQVRFDFNRVRGSDYGQWSKKVAAKPLAGLPAKCKHGW